MTEVERIAHLAAILTHCGIPPVVATGSIGTSSSSELRGTLADALTLVQAGESMPGPWIYSHCDHKPENCLVQAGLLAVLDWDECKLCHPRFFAPATCLSYHEQSDCGQRINHNPQSVFSNLLTLPPRAGTTNGW